jgi:RNA polymerase sigma factor (sigma-70 family)
MKEPGWWTTIDASGFVALRRRLLARLGGKFPSLPAADCEDLIQHAFVKLLRRPEDVSASEDGIYKWLYRVAVNYGYDLVRASARRAQRLTGAEFISNDVADAAVAREILEKFDALSELDRSILRAHVLDGSSTREIATQHQMSVSSAARAISAALLRLRVELRRS